MTPLKHDPSVEPAVRKLLAQAPLPEGLPERHRFEARRVVVPLSTLRTPKITRLLLVAAVLASASALLAKTGFFDRNRPAPPERSSEPAVTGVAPAPPPKRLPPVTHVPTVAPALENAGESPKSPPRPPASSAKSTPSLDAELAALRDARALLTSDPSAALRRARTHVRDFPEARLATEASILEIEALVRLGRTTEANARKHEVLSGPGGSLYRERLETLVPTGEPEVDSDAPKP